MDKRCFHELGTPAAEEAAKWMEVTEESSSIEEIELANNVLTLTEVV